MITLCEVLADLLICIAVALRKRRRLRHELWAREVARLRAKDALWTWDGDIDQ